MIKKSSVNWFFFKRACFGPCICIIIKLPYLMERSPFANFAGKRMIHFFIKEASYMKKQAGMLCTWYQKP